MGWIVFLWIGVLIITGTTGYFTFQFYNKTYYGKKKKSNTIVSAILAALTVIVLVIGVITTSKLTHTESFKRFKKSWDSEFDGGITREITVYLESGDVIYNVEGKFDVEHNEERLKFVDEEGKVQIIYLGRSSTAIVNEK